MPNDTARLTLPEPKYALFNAERQGLPEVIVANEALLSFTERTIFPWHLIVRLFAAKLADNGMPTPDESKSLFELGDVIEEAIVAAKTKFGSTNVLFLARSTWNEQRELDYYVHDPEITNAILQGLVTAPNPVRKWDYEMKHDPKWENAMPVFKLFLPDRDYMASEFVSVIGSKADIRGRSK